jgi:sulfate transport system ATP-binding protein
MHLAGLAIQAPEHQGAQDAQALAYVRPHDLQVERYRAGGSGIVAELQRAIVVGPIARLELWPQTPSVTLGPDRLIEAQMSCERFAELGLRQGEKLLVSPRQAKVFLQA